MISLDWMIDSAAGEWETSEDRPCWDRISGGPSAPAAETTGMDSRDRGRAPSGAAPAPVQRSSARSRQIIESGSTSHLRSAAGWRPRGSLIESDDPPCENVAGRCSHDLRKGPRHDRPRLTYRHRAPQCPEGSNPWSPAQSFSSTGSSDSFPGSQPALLRGSPFSCNADGRVSGFHPAQYRAPALRCRMHRQGQIPRCGQELPVLGLSHLPRAVD